MISSAERILFGVIVEGEIREGGKRCSEVEGVRNPFDSEVKRFFELEFCAEGYGRVGGRVEEGSRIMKAVPFSN